MRIHILISILIGILFKMHAQNAIYTRNAMSSEPSIEIKWYTQELVIDGGVDIYRKTENAEWIKLSLKPVLFGSEKPSKAELSQDPELQKYLEILQNEKKPKDLILLATLLKSFNSKALSKYLGIYFIDSTVSYGTIYSYKIHKAGTEMVLATSIPIKSDVYTAIPSPEQIRSRTSRNTISFRWLPEPTRYLGLNIYRKIHSEKDFLKINGDPIMISSHIDSSEQLKIPAWLFEDKGLTSGKIYQYQFEAIDFFGSPSIRTAPLNIYLRDFQFPASPDSIWGIPDGKKNTIHWKKQNPENDLKGFNVYRTNKNDTDYTKINKELLSTSTRNFTDQVPDFSSYLYIISCVDKDSNETKSNPVFVKVYDNESPSIPVNIQITADSGKIIIRWQPNSESDLKGYYIYRTIDVNNKNKYVKLTPTTYTGTEFIDLLPVNAKNRFLYKLCSVDQSLNRSNYSDPVGIRMPDIVAPSSPFLKNIVFDENENPVIEWFSNAEPDLASYEILRRKSGDGSQQFEPINARPISPHVHKFTDRHTLPGVYEYALRAIDSAGNRSLRSNVLYFKVKAKNQDQNCSLQFTCVYNPKKEKVELKWKSESSVELRGFVLFRLQDQEKSMTPLTGCVNTLAFLDHQVTKNAKYTYQVRAYLANGDVFHSKPLTIITR